MELEMMHSLRENERWVISEPLFEDVYSKILQPRVLASIVLC